MKRVKGNGILKAYIEYEVRDKYGKLVTKKRMPCRSLVANFLRYLRRLWMTEGITCLGSLGATYCGFSGTEPQDTTPTARPVLLGAGGSGTPPTVVWMKIDALLGVVTSGIRVGTTDTPVTISQTNLFAPIAHGTGVGQLSHGACTLDALIESNPTVTLKIIRTFSNGSGGTVTVKEIGLFCYGMVAIGPVHASFLLSRDVPSPAIDVLNGQTLTIRYVLATTV